MHAAAFRTLGIPEKKALADHLPTVTSTAKNLATEITNYNVVRKNLCGESPITTEHVQNNSDVRYLLLRRGITPKNLPPEEGVKKLERRVRPQEKMLAKRVPGFQKKEDKQEYATRFTILGEESQLLMPHCLQIHHNRFRRGRIDVHLFLE